MKKCIIIILVLLTANYCQAQGVKKPKTDAALTNSPKPAAQQNKIFTVEYRERTDTLKVKLICFGEGNEMIWLYGYCVRVLAIFKDNKTQPQPLVLDKFYDDKWAAVKETDILTAVQYQ